MPEQSGKMVEKAAAKNRVFTRSGMNNRHALGIFVLNLSDILKVIWRLPDAGLIMSG